MDLNTDDQTKNIVSYFSLLIASFQLGKSVRRSQEKLEFAPMQTVENALDVDTLNSVSYLQVWHALSRDLTVLPALSCVYRLTESTMP